MSNFPKNTYLMIRLAPCFALLLVVNASLLMGQSPDVVTEVPLQQHAVKINFLSPATSYYVELIYERALKKDKNIELSVGYIGIGDNAEVMTMTSQSGLYIPEEGRFIEALSSTSKGGFGRIGYKFLNFLDSEFNNDSRNPFSGEYIRPELTIGSYGVDVIRYGANQDIVTNRETRTFGAFIINVGGQGVIANVLLFDLYFGVGYG